MAPEFQTPCTTSHSVSAPLAIRQRIVAPFVCAAATNDFYGTLLQRGIAHVNSGSFEAGARELRIAAFGLVDNIPQFEVAQIYLAIASEKLGREADARHASQRVLAAERIEPRYASLQIDAATQNLSWGLRFERFVAVGLRRHRYALAGFAEACARPNRSR